MTVLKAPPGKFRVIGEIWKPCLDGYYEISNLGRLRRLAPAKSTWPGRLLAQFPTRKGYIIAHAYVGTGKANFRNVSIHELVAEAFIGPCPPGKEVNHRDLNKSNNRWSNLEYKTHLANVRHACRNGHSGGAPIGSVAGEKNGRAKIKNVDASEIRSLYFNRGYSQRRLAKMYGLKSKTTIGRLVRGETYAAA